MNDEIIWNVINNHFCSFKVQTATQDFCRNEFNVTGLCNRQSCPLANSRYATIKEIDGVVYLYVKTVERAHSPAKLWEKIKLSKNYATALEQIDKELEFWPKFMIHKNKQRLTKITQYLIRMRRLKLRGTGTKITTVKKKLDRREASREAKAEKAARLEHSIEKELLERLKKGLYGDGIVNESQEAFAKALDQIEDEEEVDEEAEEEEEMEDEEEMEMEMDGDDDLLDREFVSDVSTDEEDEGDLEDLGLRVPSKNRGKAKKGFDFVDSDDDDSDDDADIRPQGNARAGMKRKALDSKKPGPSTGKRGKKAHLNVEYEHETEPAQSSQSMNW
ncbi:putative MAK16 protein [Cladochytrium replicatum]|nr:putative MAK16 protein [Cladochytrium replicatum]